MMVSLRSFLLCLASALVLAATCASATCVATSAQPFPLAGNAIAMVEASTWVLSTLARDYSGVRIYNLTTSANTHVALASRASCSTSTNNASYAPVFGQSLSVVSNTLVAIGAPNRFQSSPAYSTIDLVNPALLVAGGVYASVATTLFDLTTNNLGLLLAADTVQTFLASYYDAGTIVIFSPLVGRTSMSYDSTSASDDALVTLPTDFTLDSIAINKGILVASGVSIDATSGNCVPRVLTYVFIATTLTTSRYWTQSSSTSMLRDSSSSTSADINAVPCFVEPASNLPLELSQDGSKLLMGVPSQGCVFAVDVAFGLSNVHTLTSHPRCADSSQLGENFGLSASFSFKNNGSTFVVASESTLSQYLFADWANTALSPLDPSYSSFYAYPNRLQALPSSSSSSRLINSAVSRSSLSVILYAPSGSAPVKGDLVSLVSRSAVGSGQQWNPATSALESCPAGRYSTGAGSSYAGCQYCAPGTYQSITGQSSCSSCTSLQYCPSGSVTNQLLVSSFTTATSFSSVLPWFQYDGTYQEAFEELLVGKIFSVSAWPAMIIFFILLCFGLLIYFASFWADADGDEKECCGTGWGNCCLHTYRLLGRFKYFTMGRAGPFPYSKRPKETVADVVHYGPNGEPIHTSQPAAGTAQPTKPANVTQVHNADGSVTTTTHEPVLPAEDDKTSPEFEGFMSFLFVLFALSAVAYTGIYLASYDPDSVSSTEDQNVYRTRVMYQRANNLEAEFSQSIDALLGNAFTIQVGLLGTSATCASGVITDFSWSGCTYPNPTTGGQPLACSALLSSASYSASNTTSSCSIVLSFPSGTVFPASSSFGLGMASATNFQALQLGIAQAATDITLSLPSTGTQGSSANDENTALIAAYSFSETLYMRDSTSSGTAQLPVSPITRSWQLTPVAYRTQRKSQWADVFNTTWYPQASDLDSPVLTSETPAASVFSVSTSGLSVNVSLAVSSTFTVNQTQRLIGRKGVLMTMVLACVFIWYLVRFAEAIFLIIYFTCCRRVHRGMVTVAQTTGAKGPATAQQQPEYHHGVMQGHPARVTSYPDVVRHPSPGPHPMPYGGYPQDSQGFNPYDGALPYGPHPHDGRPRGMTPRHYPGQPMPRTPGPMSMPMYDANPHSTFADDRSLYARQRAAQTPTRAHFHDPRDDRIEIEMSNTRQTRPGFEF